MNDHSYVTLWNMSHQLTVCRQLMSLLYNYYCCCYYYYYHCHVECGVVVGVSLLREILTLQGLYIEPSTMWFLPTEPSNPLGSVNEYQLRLVRQRQVWFIPLGMYGCMRGVQVKL